MGVAQGTLAKLETSEVDDTIKLQSLRRVADALGCEVVYFLVPRTNLEEMVSTQARRKAAAHLVGVAHHGRLEDQEVDSAAAGDEVEAIAAGLVDRRGLWSDGQR
jgi:predicted DNA-binding mobile mystery protein A